MIGKCTAQENNTMTQPGLKPSLLDLESNTHVLTIKSTHLLLIQHIQQTKKQ